MILPALPYIENKVTVHPEWPSFTSERGRAIRYGAARAADHRHPQPLRRTYLDPKFTPRDCADIVAAVRKN